METLGTLRTGLVYGHLKQGKKQGKKPSFQSKSKRNKSKNQRREKKNQEEGRKADNKERNCRKRKGFCEAQKMMQTHEQAQSQQQQLMIQNSGSLSFNSNLSKEEEEMSRSALTTFRAKEEEIERRKLEVREKVQAQLGRVEEETKRLALIREVRPLKTKGGIHVGNRVRAHNQDFKLFAETWVVI